MAKRHGGLLSRKQPIERRPIGFHAAGEFVAGNFSAPHFLLNLPGHDALERTGFTLRQQTFLLEEVIKIRTDVALVSCRACEQIAFGTL
jgi:hypothetical protein